MQSQYLQMYLDGKLIDEVPLNYSGLQSLEEREWYHRGTINSLCEEHEILLHMVGLQPNFVIGSDDKVRDDGFIRKHSGSNIFL